MLKVAGCAKLYSCELWNVRVTFHLSRATLP